MIKEVKMYTMICDRCGKDICAGADFAAWNDPDYVKDSAVEEGWQEIDGKNYCTDCFEYDDNDETIIKPN